MDLDLFEQNITENATFDPNTEYEFHPYYYVEIPTAIVAVLSSIANALIIFIIIRFRVLHTRLYFYLANWCICNFAVTASSLTTLNVLEIVDTVSTTAFCIWTEASFAFMFGNLMFVATVLLDWYIMTFTNQSYCSINCRRQYKLIAAVIWVLVACFLVVSVMYCIDFVEIPLLVLVVCLSYLSVSVLILIISILRLIKLNMSSVLVEKSNLEFKLVISHFICWSPNIIFLMFHITYNLSYILAYISYIIWYSNACVILLILFFKDKSFRSCLSSLFKIKFNISDNDKKDVPLIVI